MEDGRGRVGWWAEHSDVGPTLYPTTNPSIHSFIHLFLPQTNYNEQQLYPGAILDIGDIKTNKIQPLP